MKDAIKHLSPCRSGGDFSLRDMNEVIGSMDQHATNMRGLFAMPSDIETLFHFGETDSRSEVTTYTTQEWIERAVTLYPDRFFGLCLFKSADRGIDVFVGQTCNESRL